jgi:hypothetical protein
MMLQLLVNESLASKIPSSAQVFSTPGFADVRAAGRVKAFLRQTGAIRWNGSVGSAAGTLPVIKCLGGCAPRVTTGASTG